MFSKETFGVNFKSFAHGAVCPFAIIFLKKTCTHQTFYVNFTECALLRHQKFADRRHFKLLIFCLISCHL